MCLRVEPATEEVMFEAIAEPQEQLELAQPEVSENPAQGPVDRSTDQQPEGKPRCITPISNYATLIIDICISCALEYRS